MSKTESIHYGLTPKPIKNLEQVLEFTENYHNFLQI
jgi:hypothetical protein